MGIKCYQKERNREPDPIPINKLEIIIEQSKRYLCKINNGVGSGFFCAIPFPDKYNKLPVLITNNHVLKEKDIINGKKIEFSVDNNKFKFEIIIDEYRKTYTNKMYDITIIELKEKDGVDINSLLEIDEQIFDDNLQEIYEKKTVYIIQYPQGNINKFSHGIIKGIENYDIEHLCQTLSGSSGSPILILSTNKVIGVHKGSSPMNWNVGTILKEPILKFYEKFGVDINKIQIQKIDEINIEYVFRHNSKISKEDKEFFEKTLNDSLSSYKIFGEAFVKNNKNICKIIFNNKEYELCSYLNDLVENVEQQNSLEIKLKGINKITDMSYMFCGCISLSYLPDIDNMKTNNVTNMKGLFSGCRFLSYLPDIGKWNIKNVNDLSFLFYDCFKLTNFPNIDNWNTSHVINMSNMFDNCKYLNSLPDISKWDISNVRDISFMFHCCSELISFPDISKFNTKNITNMSNLFAGLVKLSYLPDISNWDTSNVTDMTSLFLGCKSLKYLPDLSKWNVENVRNMTYMFSTCSSLSSLPDLSKWNTKNVTDMSFMFCECSSLISLPDISKWNIKNVKNMISMFMCCSSLSSVPDISEWGNDDGPNCLFMFSKCKPTLNVPEKLKRFNLI